MEPLVSVVSCIADAKSGKNRIAREWLTPPHIFLMGDGTPTGEDESALEASWATRHYNYSSTPQAKIEYTPESDEIIFPLPDDYLHAVYKVRAGFRWALKHNYTQVFQCSVDTYIDASRLFPSKHDYCGWETGCGGRGFWVSERAMNILADAPIDCWAWDAWVGQVLANHGITIRADRRYGQYPMQPTVGNDLITCHMNISPNNYTIERAREVLRRRYGSDTTLHVGGEVS